MKNKVMIIFSMLLIISLCVSSASFAETTAAQGDLEPVIEEVIDGNTDCEVIDPVDADISNIPPVTKAVAAKVWRIDSKTLITKSDYGNWKTVDEVVVPKKNAPMTVKCEGSATFSSSITGSLAVSRSALVASLGFSVSNSFKVSSTMIKKNAGAGTWYFKLRPVRYKYKVVQGLYTVIPGTGRLVKTGTTRICYVYKYDHFSKTLTTSK